MVFELFDFLIFNSVRVICQHAVGLAAPFFLPFEVDVQKVLDKENHIGPVHKQTCVKKTLFRIKKKTEKR